MIQKVMFEAFFKRVKQEICLDWSHGKGLYRLTPLVTFNRMDNSIGSFIELITDMAVTQDGYLVDQQAKPVVSAKFNFGFDHPDLDRILNASDCRRTSLRRIPAKLYFPRSNEVNNSPNTIMDDYLMFDGKAFYFKNMNSNYVSKSKRYSDSLMI